MPCDIPSLTLPRIASGPITKRSEAETKPSTNGLSLDALNLLRRFSPKESRRVSRESAEPKRPPRSIDARIMRRDAPFGKEEVKDVLQRGIIADVAPSKVISPRMSVIKLVADLVIRVPTAIPIVDPTMIATTLITVPSPINIE
jgi:hypothetical protein